MVRFERPARTGRIGLPGVSVHYLEWPQRHPGGVPIVLLHPNRTNARVFDFLVDASRLGNRFIAPDQRGHGHSSYPGSGYQLDDYVADDLAFLDALGLSRVVLVGAATGGNIALLIASRDPTRVAGLVVADPGLSLDPAINARVQQQISREHTFPDIETARARMPFSDRWSEAMREHYAAHSFAISATGEATWRYEQSAARETEAALETDMWDLIDVRCPALLLRGADSEVFPAERMARLAELIPQAGVFAVDGCDHRISQDNPTEMARLLDDFVEDSGLAASGAR
jgi:pimeloyl-ACP methyl ester carboxylesterase